MNAPHYPLFLDLSGRAVLVAGGGPVAQRRVRALLDAGAEVTVVSPWVTEDMRAVADSGELTWHQRDFQDDDLASVWLVHACTGDHAVDARIVTLADRLRVWSVRASDAARSSAWSAATAATVDGVQFAVNGGGDPGRAVRLRDAIADLSADGALPLRRVRDRGRREGRVYLVGGGPGDPDLLTVRARRLLSLADVVVTDRLAPVAVLDTLASDVELVDVGKTPGHHVMPQEEINELLVDRARQGLLVVRLKGGDPFVLGRGGEEALACAAAGVAVEVVPGVTSAVSVPGAAGIPVTHRGLSTSALILSGHDGPEKVVRRAAATPPDTTLVLLMGVRHLGAIAAALVAAGRPADLPAAVVTEGWTNQQQAVSSTLAHIAEDAAGLGSPAVIVIGEVARLHHALGSLATPSLDAGHGGLP